MPPSTVNVRNGWPTTASTTASQIQMLVATMKPSRAPSRSESCLTGIMGSAALRRAAFFLLEERGDQRDQSRGLERLRDKAIGPQGHGVPPDIDGSRALDARHRDDLHRRPLAAESADRLQPPLPGQGGLQTIGRLRREWRSEEHTSELQSQSNLVCRLLLEKKKRKT